MLSGRGNQDLLNVPTIVNASSFRSGWCPFPVVLQDWGTPGSGHHHNSSQIEFRSASCCQHLGQDELAWSWRGVFEELCQSEDRGSQVNCRTDPTSHVYFSVAAIRHHDRGNL